MSSTQRGRPAHGLQNRGKLQRSYTSADTFVEDFCFKTKQKSRPGLEEITRGEIALLLFKVGDTEHVNNSVNEGEIEGVKYG